jgi:mitochondrial fission protein ELM1
VPDPLRLWLVDEGAHGHRAQSQGVVAAIERAGWNVEVWSVEARDRLPGAFRSPLRLVVDRAPPRLADWAAHRASRFEVPAAVPDLVVSSGGKSVFANVALARATGAANLFVGDPRPYPPRWFSAVLAPSAIAGATNVHMIGAPPTLMTPERCAEAAARRWPEAVPARVWALLVGGASRSHRFDDADYAALAEGANALARRQGIRWVVSTSRRSGAAADAILAERLAPEAVVETTLFSRCPKPVTAAYLGAAERVFVTQDSLTMLSEAIASDRPVVALAPADVRLARRSSVRVMLEQFDGVAGFERRAIAAMADYQPAGDGTGAARDFLRELDGAVAAVLAELNLATRARRDPFRGSRHGSTPTSPWP